MISSQRKHLRRLCLGVSFVDDTQTPQDAMSGEITEVLSQGSTKKAFKYETNETQYALLTVEIPADRVYVLAYACSLLAELMVTTIVYQFMLQQPITSRASIKNNIVTVTQSNDDVDTQFPLQQLFSKAQNLNDQVTVSSEEDSESSEMNMSKHKPKKQRAVLTYPEMRIYTKLFDGDYSTLLADKLGDPELYGYLKPFLDIISKLQRKYCVASMDTKPENVLVEQNSLFLCPSDFDRGIVLLHKPEQVGDWHILETQKLRDMTDDDNAAKILCLNLNPDGEAPISQNDMMHYTPPDHLVNYPHLTQQYSTESIYVYQGSEKQCHMIKAHFGEVPPRFVSAAPKSLKVVHAASKFDQVDQLCVSTRVAKTLMVNCFRCDLLNALHKCYEYLNAARVHLTLPPNDPKGRFGLRDVIAATTFDQYYDQLKLRAQDSGFASYES